MGDSGSRSSSSSRSATRGRTHRPPGSSRSGTYEVRFKPADDGPTETLVDKLEVQPGKLIKVE